METASGGSIELPENLIVGGELGGLVDFRSETLDRAQSELGRIAASVALTVNAQSALGQDLLGQANGDAGFEGNFFATSGLVSVAKANSLNDLSGSPVISVSAERQRLGFFDQGDAANADLAVCEHPYAQLGAACGLDEASVIERLAAWVADGSIKRLGVIVRHRELGFEANAMLVHDIPDDQVDDIAQALAGESAVTLCYRRPRRGSKWPFNLFCMIHGQCRNAVLGQIAALRDRHALAGVPHAVLFSERCFKQTGARYV